MPLPVGGAIDFPLWTTSVYVDLERRCTSFFVPIFAKRETRLGVGQNHLPGLIRTGSSFDRSPGYEAWYVGSDFWPFMVKRSSAFRVRGAATGDGIPCFRSRIYELVRLVKTPLSLDQQLILLFSKIQIPSSVVPSPLRTVHSPASPENGLRLVSSESLCLAHHLESLEGRLLVVVRNPAMVSHIACDHQS
jgi:hypothetical protein